MDVETIGRGGKHGALQVSKAEGPAASTPRGTRQRRRPKGGLDRPGDTEGGSLAGVRLVNEPKASWNWPA